MEMLLENRCGAELIRGDFNAPIFGLHQCSASSVWMPIIETYRRKNSDGQIIYSLEKALWTRRQNGEFERCEWDDELGAIIDKSHAYYKTETIRAAAAFIESMPVPILKTIQVDYQLYVPGISDTLKIMVAAFNSFAKLANYRELVHCDNQNYYAM